MSTKTWTIDPAHVVVEFSVRHLGLVTVRGVFQSVRGTLELDDDDPTRSKGYVEIDASSLNTNQEKRDEHLRSADFFHVDQHPLITLTSREIVPVGEGQYRVNADLTIRGVTEQVELEAELSDSINDPWGNTRRALSLSGTLNRTRWGLNWNSVVEAGRMVVGEKVKISGEAELVLQAVEVAA
jgi:polyisoprenoid-binding protein YceI